MGGDLEQAAARQEPAAGDRRVQGLPGRAGRRLPVRARAHQGRDLSRTSSTRPTRALVGQVVNPFARKLLLEPGARPGSRCVDLLAAVPARARGRASGQRAALPAPGHPLDHRGLELAAAAWSPRASSGTPGTASWQHAADATPRSEARFTRYGDLHSRLPEAEQEALPARDAGRPAGAERRRHALRGRSRQPDRGAGRQLHRRLRADRLRARRRLGAHGARSWATRSIW